MFAVILLGLLAGCTAAPHYHNHPGNHPHFPERPDIHWYPYFDTNEPIFDTRKFWSDLHNELRELDNMLNEFNKKFPTITGQQRIQGNEYHVTIPLSGFEENEVVVKAREGVLMVQAVHKTEGGGENSYLDVKTLPECVNVSGSWKLENGVLKIVFPLKNNVNVPQVTETPVTEGPQTEPITAVLEHSREEMDSGAENEDATADADVGIRGDLEKGRDIQTNEIPRNSVEATTYAVDFKDEVEFVPVRY